MDGMLAQSLHAERPTTSGGESEGRRLHSRGRPSTAGGQEHYQDTLYHSQMNLAAALLDAAAKGSRLTENQKAELRAATERFGAATLELARLERHAHANGGVRTRIPVKPAASTERGART